MSNHFQPMYQIIVSVFQLEQMIIQNEFFSFVSHFKPLGKGLSSKLMVCFVI